MELAAEANAKKRKGSVSDALWPGEKSIGALREELAVCVAGEPERPAAHSDWLGYSPPRWVAWVVDEDEALNWGALYS